MSGIKFVDHALRLIEKRNFDPCVLTSILEKVGLHTQKIEISARYFFDVLSARVADKTRAPLVTACASHEVLGDRFKVAVVYPVG